MTPLSFALVALGIALLYAGGEALVRGAVDLARQLGLSSMVIGLTVVAFATSAPELAATLMASLRGAPELAIGNVLGSNIANLGLILGIAALVAPLTAKAQYLKREIPLMLAATIVFYPLARFYPMTRNGVIGRVEGAFLLLLLAGYLYTLLSADESEVVHPEVVLGSTESQSKANNLLTASLIVAVGIFLLVLGAWALVTGATRIALALGVTERVVGLTMVAFGTSLPELASSIVAARRNEGDIVLGNVVGSNVFNILCILGSTALVRPIPVSHDAIAIDFWIVLAFTALVLPMLMTRMRLGRREGTVLLLLYFGYVGWLLTG